VAAWLRWGEREAAKVDAPAFDVRRFREVLQEIRPSLDASRSCKVFNRITATCAEAGVVIVLIPELAGTHLSGAARWLGNKAVIQLSLRHKSDDQFWFTLFHEAGHLLSSTRRLDFLDSAEPEPNDDAEEAADKFARDVLLPAGEYVMFVEASDFSTTAVRRFAQRQAVAPGIVVGRLQRDEFITPQQLRHLKKPIHFPSDR
jgi:HTH-type transcriptional regulator / antitoxin HigA